MPRVVQFTRPRQAEFVREVRAEVGPRDVRVRTIFSGISAGTELTAYRGVNPFLDRTWDPRLRLFLPGAPSLRFPVVGWGYEEVGEIVGLGARAEGVTQGDVVWGSWGHRSETVMPDSTARVRRLAPGVDPLTGVFAKIGAIALNAAHDAEISPGDTVAIFGLGVPGQLAAQFARRSGARVIGVDPDAARRGRAIALGSELALDPGDGDIARTIRDLTDGRGADAAIEVSGAGIALHEAIRTVGYNSRVVVAGFHQGGGDAIRLGEEFHHNRITLVSSQISGVGAARDHRWDELRLASEAIRAAVSGEIRVAELVSHVVPAAEAESAFRMLDEGGADILQVVLDFRSSTDDDTAQASSLG